MIEYVEIRDDNLKVIAIIDVAKSIIWRSVYYGVGDFELYLTATPEIVAMIQPDRYITRPDNAEVGIIESINITNTEQDGRMIIARGRFAKSILDRRHINKLVGSTNNVTILNGNVETAVRNLVQDNAINCPYDSNRNIPVLDLGGASNIPYIIVDYEGKAAEKQVTYENLLEYTDGVLEEYEMASRCVMGNEKLLYQVYTGTDRSTGNADGLIPIVFSREFDNLTESEYMYDTTTHKNAAIIGGTGEGVERYYSALGTQYKGLQRRETFIDAASISRTYKDDNDEEQTYSEAEYKAMLDAKGKQDLAPLVITEALNGVVDVTNGNYIYGRDFALGDIVTVQDKEINKYINVRIIEVLEAQDENGYTIEVNYQ